MASTSAVEVMVSGDLSNQSSVRRPSTFLSLAPTTSASYPQQPRLSSPPASIVAPKLAAIDAVAATVSVTSPQSATVETVTVSAVTETLPGPAVIDEDAHTSRATLHRRSSSLTSDGSTSGSGNAKLRFLKLGPVHWGEGDGDWSEVSIVE